LALREVPNRWLELSRQLKAIHTKLAKLVRQTNRWLELSRQLKANTQISILAVFSESQQMTRVV